MDVVYEQLWFHFARSLLLSCRPLSGIASVVRLFYIAYKYTRIHTYNMYIDVLACVIESVFVSVSAYADVYVYI